MIWSKKDDKKQFVYEDTDDIRAEYMAKECCKFIFDDEEEIIDDKRSCFNCAFRKWGEQTIFCLNKEAL